MGRTTDLRLRRKALREKQHTTSASSVLHEILQTARHVQQWRGLEKAMHDYCNSLSVEEMNDQVRWGEFVMREFQDAAGERPFPSFIP